MLEVKPYSDGVELLLNRCMLTFRRERPAPGPALVTRRCVT